jgi:hypothetical protein
MLQHVTQLSQHHIIHDLLHFSKECTRWVPTLLNLSTECLEQACFGTPLLLQGQGKRIVQQNCYQRAVIDPSIPTHIKMCIHALEAPQTSVTKKFKVMAPAEQTVHLLVHFQKSGKTINAASYCLVLCTFWTSVAENNTVY